MKPQSGENGEGHWVQRAAFEQAKQDVLVLYQMIRAGEEAGDILDDEEDALLYQIARQWNLEPRPKKPEGPDARGVLVFPGKEPGRVQVMEMLLTYDPDDGATEAARFTSLEYHDDIGWNTVVSLVNKNAALNDVAGITGIAAYGEATINSCQPIFREIESERVAQDRQWGGATHDDSHDRSEWPRFIEGQLRASEARGVTVQEFEGRMVKIAALAVAAIQSSRRLARSANAGKAQPVESQEGSANNKAL